MSVDTANPAVENLVRCDACPVTCVIRPGLTGACDRYMNNQGRLERVDTHLVLDRTSTKIAFAGCENDWDERPFSRDIFVTAIGAGTSYPEIKPAPFIVSSNVDGLDFVTVVTEGIFSYCGVKLKVDTDRHIGDERALVRVDGEPVGHVTTAEYGSAMLSVGGVNHLTGGGKREGRATCDALVKLCSAEAVTLTVDGGAELTLQAGVAPIIDGRQEERMRVGCGSAVIGMFAPYWSGLVDEVVVVDDHITGVLSEHLAGKYLKVPATGIRVRGRRSTPGRYFETAAPGSGWGGTNVTDPLSILGPFDAKVAKPGLSLLMVSTTGEHVAYFELDKQLRPIEAVPPGPLLNTITELRQNCEPARTSVIFMGGAGGSMRAGVARNPIRLTRSVQEGTTRMTCGGAPVHLWPGGGITFMVDVLDLPARSFGAVPTPAVVAPIEFTMAKSQYEALGGHVDRILPVSAFQKHVRRPPLNDDVWPLRPF